MAASLRDQAIEELRQQAACSDIERHLLSQGYSPLVASTAARSFRAPPDPPRRAPRAVYDPRRERALAILNEGDRQAWGKRTISLVPVIRIFGEIGGIGKNGRRGVTASDVEEKLRLYPSRPPTVSLLIDSPGGSATEAKSIYTLLRSLNCPIEARIAGMCASAATVVAMAASFRECGPESKFCLMISRGARRGANLPTIAAFDAAAISSFLLMR